MRVLPTVLLTGAPGVGKTAVAKEMGELLLRAKVRHAVIDLDALGEVSPPCSGGTFNSPLVAHNLAAIGPNYRDHGVDRLVLARVVGGKDEVAAYRRITPSKSKTTAQTITHHPCTRGLVHNGCDGFPQA